MQQSRRRPPQHVRRGRVVADAQQYTVRVAVSSGGTHEVNSGDRRSVEPVTSSGPDARWTAFYLARWPAARKELWDEAGPTRPVPGGAAQGQRGRLPCRRVRGPGELRAFRRDPD